jgi:hypothetical protein
MKLLIAAALFCAASAEITISSVVPQYVQGSTLGGTLLRIRGSGFFREGRESTLTVFVVSAPARPAWGTTPDCVRAGC